MVLVTHFMDEAERLCDRLAVVDRGRVVASGTPQGLIDLYAPQVLVRFSSDAPDLDFLYRVAGVEGVTRRGKQVEVAGTGPVLALVAAVLVERGVDPRRSARRASHPGRGLPAAHLPARRGGVEVNTLRKMVVVELKLFLREPLTVVFAIALPLITLFVLGGVFGNTPDPEYYRGAGPIDFYTPAYVGLVLASIGVVSLPAHLAGNRERGVLRRFRASWVPAAFVVGAEVVVSLVIATVSAAVLVTCALTVYGAAGPQSALLVVPAFLLSALTFAAVGVMLGALLPTARAAQAAGMLFWFVMLFLGGAGPPPEVLTGALRALRHFVPLTYVVSLLQGPWLGLGWSWTDTAIVAAWGLVAALVTARWFRWE